MAANHGSKRAKRKRLSRSSRTNSTYLNDFKPRAAEAAKHGLSVVFLSQITLNTVGASVASISTNSVKILPTKIGLLASASTKTGANLKRNIRKHKRTAISADADA